LYVNDERHVATISHWGFCEHANERNMLAYFQQSIVPSIAALRLVADDFGKATMPVLIVHGDKDRSAAYGGGRDWAASLPDARLLTIADAAHVPWLEAPNQTIAGIAAFLNGEWPLNAESLG
jgi:pimeloyl-ACP methyl ester carboxylesterase